MNLQWLATYSKKWGLNLAHGPRRNEQTARAKMWSVRHMCKKEDHWALLTPCWLLQTTIFVPAWSEGSAGWGCSWPVPWSRAWQCPTRAFGGCEGEHRLSLPFGHFLLCSYSQIFNSFTVWTNSWRGKARTNRSIRVSSGVVVRS